MVSPTKMPSMSLPPLVMRKIFGTGHGGVWLSSRAPARGLSAERLLPGEGGGIELRPIERLRECGRRRVADGKSGAIGRDPVGIGHPHARRRAVPGEHDIACRIDRAEIGQLAIGGPKHGYVLELELLGH